MPKNNPKTKNSKIVNVPVPIYVINSRQKPRDKIPQPNPKTKPTWHEVTKQQMLQNPTPNFEAKMPSETIPAEDRRGHHHPQ